MPCGRLRVIYGSIPQLTYPAIMYVLVNGRHITISARRERLTCYQQDNPQKRIAILHRLDNADFDWQVFLVSASGFFTDSYALFATNVILPSLAYLYWPNTTNNHPELTINCVTLGGSMCGQIFFGVLADLYGRRRLYGVELVMVIFATLGMAQASTGLKNSMSIMGWIVFWRFVIGMGIGAEYPLSGVITAEFAGVKARAKMMAAVFLMQPLGQLTVAVVGWVALVGVGRARGINSLPADGNALDDQQRGDVIAAVDTVWRCVVGVGAFPALLAIIYRFSIPESPRYTMDVVWNFDQALSDVITYQGGDAQAGVLTEAPPTKMSAQPAPAQQNGQKNGHLPLPTQTIVQPVESHSGSQPSGQASQSFEQGGAHVAIQLPTQSVQVVPNYFAWQELKKFFWKQGNLRYLAATSICWFLLDFAFYGLGIGNPRQLAAIWAASNSTEVLGWPYTKRKSPYATFSNGTFPDWENPFNSDTNMYQELFNDALKYTITVSIGSVLGSVALLCCINHLNRKFLLVASFITLFFLFAITGATLRAVEFKSGHIFTIVLYGLCQFFFDFGKHCSSISLYNRTIVNFTAHRT